MSEIGHSVVVEPRTSRGVRLSIPTRIFLGFALVLAAFGGVAMASLHQHRQTSTALALLDDGYLPLALTVGEARATQAVFGTLLDRVLDERDTTATRSWLDVALRVRPTTVQRALSEVERAEGGHLAPEDQRALDDVRAKLSEVDEAYRATESRYGELFRALDAGDEARAAVVLADLRREERVIQRKFREAWNQLQERITHTSSQAAEQERTAAVQLGLLTLLALGMGVLVTFWSQRVLKPLPLLHERVEAVARGDLSRRLEPKSDDELGRLTRAFERMVETLALRDARLREAAEAQRRLQRMQEQIVVGLRAAIIVVDGDGLIRTVNPSARSVLGLTSDRVGRPMSETGLLERLPGLEEAIRSVEKGEEFASLRGVPLAGEERFVDIAVSPFGVSDRSEAARPVLVVADDVTEELAVKARLIHTERLAAIGRMAAHVTHEVRNPLSSIGLNVDLLEDELGETGTEARALLRAIQREIDRLTAITEEYLRLARLPEPRLEPDDIGQLARDVTSFVRTELESAGIDLELSVERDLPAVAIDEGQIRQALLNLLRNAREAMPGGGRLSVSVARDEHEVRVAITDSGVGLTGVDASRIFDLFFTTKEHGSGLGLPLTQQVVAAHGGTIRCLPRDEGGTTFELRFPAIGREPDAESAA